MATDFDTLLAGLKRLVDALAFELVDLRTRQYSTTGISPSISPGTQPASVQRFRIQRYAYLANPLALGIVPIDSEYEIVFTSDMFNTRFWNHVQETLDLDQELMRPKNERLKIDVQHLKNLGLNTFGEASIVLCYAKYHSAEFDCQSLLSSMPPIVQRHGFAPDTRNGVQVNIAEALDAQELNRLIFELQQPRLDGRPDRLLTRDNFLLGYHTLRQWALNSGVISSRFNMVTEKALVHMYAQAFPDVDFRSLEEKSPDEARTANDLIYSIIRTPRFQHVAGHGVKVRAPSGLLLTSQMSRSGDSGFTYITAQAYHKAEGLQGFLDRNKYFLTFHGICWQPKRISELRDLMTKTLRGLSIGLQGRIWPYSLTDEAKGESIFLVAHDDRRHTAETLKQNLGYLKIDRKIMSLHYESLTQSEAKELVAQNIQPPPTATDDVVSDEKPRFRTAAALLNRLNWDEDHAGTDYEIGYIDRFQDQLMWKPHAKWEKHTEEEEFIPEHRIMKIRKIRDGEVVWDRETRMDKT